MGSSVCSVAEALLAEATAVAISAEACLTGERIGVSVERGARAGDRPADVYAHHPNDVIMYRKIV